MLRLVQQTDYIVETTTPFTPDFFQNKLGIDVDNPGDALEVVNNNPGIYRINMTAREAGDGKERTKYKKCKTFPARQQHNCISL